MDAETPTVELTDAQKTTRLKICMSASWLPRVIPAVTALEDGNVRLEYKSHDDDVDGTRIILNAAGVVVDMETQDYEGGPKGDAELAWQSCKGDFLWKSLHMGLHRAIGAAPAPAPSGRGAFGAPLDAAPVR
jgi:hypothetical protein